MFREKPGIGQNRPDDAKRKEIEQGVDEYSGVFDKEIAAIENAPLREMIRRYDVLLRDILSIKEKLAQEYGIEYVFDGNYGQYDFEGEDKFVIPLSRTVYDVAGRTNEGDEREYLGDIENKIKNGQILSYEEARSLVDGIVALERLLANLKQSRLKEVIREKLYDYAFEAMSRERADQEKDTWFKAESEKTLDEAIALIRAAVDREGKFVGYESSWYNAAARASGVRIYKGSGPDEVRARQAEAERTNPKEDARTMGGFYRGYRPVFDNTLSAGREYSGLHDPDASSRDYYLGADVIAYLGGRRNSTRYSILGKPVTEEVFERFQEAWDAAVSKQKSQTEG